MGEGHAIGSLGGLAQQVRVGVTAKWRRPCTAGHTTLWERNNLAARRNCGGTTRFNLPAVTSQELDKILDHCVDRLRYSDIGK